MGESRPPSEKSEEEVLPLPLWPIVLANFFFLIITTSFLELISHPLRIIGSLQLGSLTYSFLIVWILSQAVFLMASMIILRIYDRIKIYGGPWSKTLFVLILSMIFTIPVSGVVVWFITSFTTNITWAINVIFPGGPIVFSLIVFFASAFLTYFLGSFYNKIITIPKKIIITPIEPKRLEPVLESADRDVLYVGEDLGESLEDLPYDRKIVASDVDKASIGFIKKVSEIWGQLIEYGEGFMYDFLMLIGRVDEPLVSAIIDALPKIERGLPFGILFFLWIPRKLKDLAETINVLEKATGENKAVFLVGEDSPMFLDAESPEKRVVTCLEKVLQLGSAPYIDAGNIRQFVNDNICTLAYAEQSRRRAVTPIEVLISGLTMLAIWGRTMFNVEYDGKDLLPIIIAPSKDLEDEQMTIAVKNCLPNKSTFQIRKHEYNGVDKRAILIFVRGIKKDEVDAFAREFGDKS